MKATMEQVPVNENDRELSEREIAEVTGGFNPQPDPPGRAK